MTVPHIFVEAGMPHGRWEPFVTATDICLPRNDVFCAALGGVGATLYGLTPIAPDRGIPRHFFLPFRTVDGYYQNLLHWTNVTPAEWDEAIDRAGSAMHLAAVECIPGGLGSHLALSSWFAAMEATGHKVRVTVGFETEERP